MMLLRFGILLQVIAFGLASVILNKEALDLNSNVSLENVKTDAEDIPVEISVESDFVEESADVDVHFGDSLVNDVSDDDVNFVVKMKDPLDDTVVAITEKGVRIETEPKDVSQDELENPEVLSLRGNDEQTNTGSVDFQPHNDLNVVQMERDLRNSSLKDETDEVSVGKKDEEMVYLAITYRSGKEKVAETPMLGNERTIEQDLPRGEGVDGAVNANIQGDVNGDLSLEGGNPVPSEKLANNVGEEKPFVRDFLATIFIITFAVIFVGSMRRMVWKSVVSFRPSLCRNKKRGLPIFEYRYGRI